MPTAMPHWPKYVHNSLDYTFSAKRTLYVLQKLGNPHEKLKNIIQITGTNGKGSVSKYLAKILRMHGKNVCLYTSPHIHFCNERTIFNEHEINDDAIFNLTEKVRQICEKNNIQLSFFETFTVISVLWFSELSHDFCVFEVGAGGLCDATNIFIDNQVGCIFTPIDIDHADILGNSIESIMAHKIGLLQKSCRYIVSSKQSDRFFEILERNAQRLSLSDCEFAFEDEHFQCDVRGDYFSVKTHNENLTMTRPSLIGAYQFQNASLAVMMSKFLLENFNENLASEGLKIEHFCRMEEFFKGRYKNTRVIVDGAHNPHGARNLASVLRNEFSDYNVNLVVARSFHEGDENNLEFFHAFEGLNSLNLVYVTKAQEVNAESIEKLYFASLKYNFKTLKALNIKEALSLLLKYNFKSKTLIVLCGTLYARRDLIDI